MSETVSEMVSPEVLTELGRLATGSAEEHRPWRWPVALALVGLVGLLGTAGAVGWGVGIETQESQHVATKRALEARAMELDARAERLKAREFEVARKLRRSEDGVTTYLVASPVFDGKGNLLTVTIEHVSADMMPADVRAMFELLEREQKPSPTPAPPVPQTSPPDGGGSLIPF